MAFAERDGPPRPEDQPRLRRPGDGHARSVGPTQREDPSPDVRRVHHVDEHVGLGAPRRGAEIGQSIGERVLLTGEAFDEVATHDFATVLHPEQHVSQARPVTGAELASHDAVAR